MRQQCPRVPARLAAQPPSSGQGSQVPSGSSHLLLYAEHPTPCNAQPARPAGCLRTLCPGTGLSGTGLPRGAAAGIRPQGTLWLHPALLSCLLIKLPHDGQPAHGSCCSAELRLTEASAGIAAEAWSQQKAFPGRDSSLKRGKMLEGSWHQLQERFPGQAGCFQVSPAGRTRGGDHCLVVCERNRLEMSRNSPQQPGDLQSHCSPQNLWSGSLQSHGTSGFGIQLPIAAVWGR